jgi:hypothetical protein
LSFVYAAIPACRLRLVVRWCPLLAGHIHVRHGSRKCYDAMCVTNRQRRRPLIGREACVISFHPVLSTISSTRSFISSRCNRLSACSNGTPRWNRQTSIQVTATNCSSHFEILVGTRRESTTSSRFVSHPSPTFHPRPRRHPLRTAAGSRLGPATLAIAPHAPSAANPRPTTEQLASLQDASTRPRRIPS